MQKFSSLNAIDINSHKSAVERYQKNRQLKRKRIFVEILILK